MPLDHHHEEQEALVIENEAGNIEAHIMVDALQEVLIRKGLLTAHEVTAAIAKLESPGVHLGAKVVAKAWIDTEYKQCLVSDGRAAVQELGIPVTETSVIVVENTPTKLNLIICTLCSCYPCSILGQPPSWHISKAYRARSVREPCRLMAEFGLDLPMDAQLVVHDSNANMRYLVLPEPPSGPGTCGVSNLESLISRDHLIGVARAVV
ncbi:MAG: nitrile hydratase subunit alpha [Roseobacter sp.]